MRRVIVILVSLALLVVAYVGLRHARYSSPLAPTTQASRRPDSGAENSESKTPDAESASGRSHLADNLNAPTATIHADLQIVADVLAAFRSNFPHDGNPVGDNKEITAALTGKNRLKLALIPRDFPAINANGELCDRWGTPFFFHAESGTRMAVRSAGPDRKMWTPDDVVQEP